MLNKPFKPMIIRKIDEIPNDEEYVHQLKWDGHRALFHYDEGNFRIFTREQNECTLQYPEFRSLKLPVKNCILDGEMIVLNSASNPPKPCFESIMARFSAQKEATIVQLKGKLPAHLAVWDILYLNDKALLNQKLEQRLELLYKVIEPSNHISVTPTHNNGNSLYQEVLKHGLEGIVSKKLGSSYHLNSFGPWYKKKIYLIETVNIVGVRKSRFGWSLTLKDKYVGTLEFTPPSIIVDAIKEFSQQLICGENDEWIFIKPIIRCKVKFQCFTNNGMLRSPCFVELVI